MILLFLLFFISKSEITNDSFLRNNFLIQEFDNITSLNHGSFAHILTAVKENITYAIKTWVIDEKKCKGDCEVDEMMAIMLKQIDYWDLRKIAENNTNKLIKNVVKAIQLDHGDVNVNIVHLYDFWMEEHVVPKVVGGKVVFKSCLIAFVQLELCTDSMYHFFQSRHKSLSIETIFRLLFSLIETVLNLHSNRIHHGDIHGGNFLIKE